MTTNSPNPVDGDVQALIADCQAEIEKLEKAIKNINSYVKPAYRNECLSKCQSELMRQQIALAALTAEPVIYAIQNEEERKNGYMNEFSSSGIGGYVNPEKYGLTELPLYTTPPAQLLRPVEKPTTKCIGWVKESIQEHDEKWITAIREAGYEVKND